MTIAIKDFKHLKSYTKLIEKKLFSELWQLIYKPMFKILDLKAVNEDNEIIEALKGGVVYYENGGFKFREKISNKLAQAFIKIGARYDKWERSYKIAIEDLPKEIWESIKISIQKAQQKLSHINEFLSYIEMNIDDIVESMIFDSEVGTILDDVESKITKNINVIELELESERKEKMLEVINNNFQISKREIEKNYTGNIQDYTKEWLLKRIPEIREKVQKAMLEGYREIDVQKMLETEYGIAERKAKFLAQNETSIMLAQLKKATYTAMGFEHFKWQTILDARERPLHRKLHGQIFRFDEPPEIDERTHAKGLPGETYNCLTGDMQITSPFLHNRIFKRKFRGETVTLITSVGRIKLTPNHPVLTDKGWVKAGSLNIGNHIAKISNETILAGGSYPNNTKTTIDEFYSFYSLLFDAERVALTDKDFHGDVSVDQQVNTINIETKLGNYSKPYISQLRVEQVLTKANEFFGSVDTSSNRTFLQAFPFSRSVTDCFIGSLDKAFAFFFGGKSHTVEHTLGAITWLNSLLFEVTGYDTTRNSVFLSELLNAPAGSIKFYQLILWELAYTIINWRISEFSHSSGDCFAFNAEQLGQLGNSLPTPIEFDTITDKIISVFNGHIYNLENSNNWYLTQYYITKNCRCSLIPIITDDIFFNQNENETMSASRSYAEVMKNVP